ncbi:MAG: hypothetical protein ACM3WV_02370 [Bacillota bacterium]
MADIDNIDSCCAFFLISFIPVSFLLRMNYLVDLRQEKLQVEIFLYRRFRLYSRIFTPLERLAERIQKKLNRAKAADAGPENTAAILGRAVKGWEDWISKIAVEFPFVYNLLTLLPGRRPLKFVVLFSKVGHCRYFRWDTRVGTGDAFLTAIGTGVLWPLKLHLFKNLLEKVLRNVYVLSAAPKMTIKPDFKMKAFHSDLEGIFQIRAGYIIFNMFINLFYRMLPDFSSGRKKILFCEKNRR